MNATRPTSGALAALVDSFHITDRALLRARDRMRREADPASDAEFRRHALRYFRAIEREALEQLTGIDSKLDDLYQRQYNLQAERGVAERRLAVARGVLSALDNAGEERAAR